MQRPTMVRHGVLALTTTMAVLLYLDRVCISTAGDDIASELCLDKTKTGAIYGAFFFAYALGQVPAGWLGDRLGARRMLVLCVVAWSLLTALTGLATGFISLLVIRLLFGVAEAGAYPIAARVNSLWIPFSRRAFASAVVSLGGRAGGAIAPILTANLIIALGDWRIVFTQYAIPGIIWAMVFWWAFRDTPAEHPGCSESEAELIAAQPPGVTSPLGKADTLPWRDACGSFSLWMQCLAQFTTNIPFVFLITWLPTYLKEVYGTELRSIGWLASLPLLTGVAGCALGGLATDWLTHRIGLKWGRNLLGMGTKILAVAGPLGACVAGDPLLAVVAFSFSAFLIDLGLGATWAYFQDAGGPYVGTLLGWANMFGNLGAFVSPLLLGWIAQTAGLGWNVALMTCSVLYLVSGLCWLGVDARVPIIRRKPLAV